MYYTVVVHRTCTDRRAAALDKCHFGFLVRWVGGCQIYFRTWTGFLFRLQLAWNSSKSERLLSGWIREEADTCATLFVMEYLRQLSRTFGRSQMSLHVTSSQSLAFFLLCCLFLVCFFVCLVSPKLKGKVHSTSQPYTLNHVHIPAKLGTDTWAFNACLHYVVSFFSARGKHTYIGFWGGLSP